MPAQFVGSRTNPDGVSGNVGDRSSRDGAKVVSDLHGKYLEQNVRGRVYTGVSAVGGIALIAPAAGGGHPTLWNPSSSKYLVSVVRLELSWVSGNNAPGAVEWAGVYNTGSSVLTGAPFATFTAVAPTGILGGLVANQALWAPTVQTFTAAYAPVYLRPAGIALFTGVGTTAVAPFTLRADYNGDFVVAPGNAICLCYQAATTTALFQVAVTWEETPL